MHSYETKSSVEEKIKKYKLLKIETTESKIKQYEDTLSYINDSDVIKFTKNASLNVLRIVFRLITIVCILVGFYFFFPDLVISWTLDGRNEAQEIIPYIGFMFIVLAIFFIFISSLLKKNIHKRKTIYELSKLIEEVIGYMGENLEEDKIKYQYFVESMADVEIQKNKEHRESEKTTKDKDDTTETEDSKNISDHKIND